MGKKNRYPQENTVLVAHFGPPWCFKMDLVLDGSSRCAGFGSALGMRFGSGLHPVYNSRMSKSPFSGLRLTARLNGAESYTKSVASLPMIRTRICIPSWFRALYPVMTLWVAAVCNLARCRCWRKMRVILSAHGALPAGGQG